jgi:very-short-patch-repair endonuclease
MRSTSPGGKWDDTRLAGVATRQHGTVSTWQLLKLGYSHRDIHDHVTAGRLFRLHRGVYAVGHLRLSVRGRWMAAVLACGEGAVLSHRAAAALHGVGPAPSGPTDVTTPRRHRPRGIRAHHVRRLDPADATVVDGIPVTTLARTLLDLAEVVTRTRLDGALESAQQARTFDLRAVDAVIDRNPGRHGIRPLQSALADLRDDPPWVIGDGERRFRALIRRARLPEPRTNVLVDGELVDAHWPAHNLIVEVDGWRFHHTRRAFEEDRQKDVRLTLRGHRVVRYTWRRLARAPGEVEREVAALLGV